MTDAGAAHERFSLNALRFFLDVRKNGTRFFSRSDEAGAAR